MAVTCRSGARARSTCAFSVSSPLACLSHSPWAMRSRRRRRTGAARPGAPLVGSRAANARSILPVRSLSNDAESMTISVGISGCHLPHTGSASRSFRKPACHSLWTAKQSSNANRLLPTPPAKGLRRAAKEIRQDLLLGLAPDQREDASAEDVSGAIIGRQSGTPQQRRCVVRLYSPGARQHEAGAAGRGAWAGRDLRRHGDYAMLGRAAVDIGFWKSGYAKWPYKASATRAPREAQTREMR
jgi:hypothetical protein